MRVIYYNDDAYGEEKKKCMVRGGEKIAKQLNRNFLMSK